MSLNPMPNKVVKLAELKTACQTCTINRICLPCGLDEADIRKLDRLVKQRRPISAGSLVFNHGDAFRTLYIVRAGAVKTYTKNYASSDEGQEQIMGFHLPGEILGFDAISGSVHPCSAKALQTTSICELSFERLEEQLIELPSLHQHLMRIMSSELYRDEQLLLLGKKSAEERLATFLLSLSRRYAERGFSPYEFNLPMSRGDIANYLGLAVETVSRLLSKLQSSKIIRVQRKLVTISDKETLERIAVGEEAGSHG